MKRQYIKPTMESEMFVANEYVATCTEYVCDSVVQKVLDENGGIVQRIWDINDNPVVVNAFPEGQDIPEYFVLESGETICRNASCNESIVIKENQTFPYMVEFMIMGAPSYTAGAGMGFYYGDAWVDSNATLHTAEKGISVTAS